MTPKDTDSAPKLPNLDKLLFGDIEQILALGFTRKVFKFCIEYIKDPNGKQAAIKAGFSPKAAAVQASKLMKNPKVRKFIESHMHKAEKHAEITVSQIIQEIGRLAFTDIGGLFDDDNNLKNVKDWPIELRRAVSSVEIDALFDGQGQDREQIGETKKVKLWDKTKALEMLGRWRKLFTDKFELHDKSSLAERLKKARERAAARRAGKGK